MFETPLNFDLQNLTGVIVALKKPLVTITEVTHSVDEIRQLSTTLGIKIINIFIQQKSIIDSAYFIGKGKLEEISQFVNENKIDVVIFDNDLSGIQERNLEKYLTKKILDRTSIILQIFNKRARSNEAKLQVELAAMEYMAPRLKHLWTHFSRSEGIVGIRGGEGEKQLELDKRIIKLRIISIKEKLKKIDVQAKTRRKSREESYTVSLVGYTNAGKTSLMNLLSKKNLIAEDMMFSTIDSTIRKVFIDDELTILLNDTVGFINKLPHSLVASFKSTLDEIKNSKLILHVIDSSSDRIVTHIESVEKVLKEIGVENIPIIKIFNKIDLLPGKITGIGVSTKPEDVLISTITKEGIPALKEAIKKFFIA
ncbi:MAG: GTPase HflX [Spirochaetes bacterium GWF1_31_7]|nr:MAG: GTPase HflX [Spirochaetes bacterium GWE1_32_154]OHD50876.1 MAG: GTPase HflX [Spirochaetes bacterium GWF1_31_7]OHD51866.1 MAG: GTPase HflX [Spirochaetes bacterium GWE2_31_10]OHD76351.1 MAG: GTPase HflX [Spirochaetes bacterium RIFOXYB1_FULL_32_8]HBD96413.1 GTPase HflX [Spirochaetia bacterium]